MDKTISKTSFAIKMMHLCNGVSYLPKGFEEGVYNTIKENYGFKHEGTKEEVLELFKLGMTNATEYIHRTMRY